MLTSLVEFIKTIASVITSLVNLLIGFVKDIVYVVKLTGSFLAKIPSLFSWLPPELLALIVSGFGIVVIYKVLGREG